MIHINLLPHRAEKRARRQRDFTILAGMTVVVGIGVGLIGDMVIDTHITAQADRNRFLQEVNGRLDRDIAQIATINKELDLLRARQMAVENLQNERLLPVLLLDQLTKITPQGLYFKALNQDGVKVTMTGVAQSNERISDLLRTLSKTPWVGKSDLLEIKSVDMPVKSVGTRKVYEFVMVTFLLPAKLTNSQPASTASAPSTSQVASLP